MNELKEVEYFTNEWAYSCPHCDMTQGWTDYLSDMTDEDFEEPVTCDKCKMDFKVKNPNKKQDTTCTLKDCRLRQGSDGECTIKECQIRCIR